MFIAGRACVSLRKCEAAKRRAHPFNDTALSTTAGSCRSSWAENWQKMQAGDAKMEVPWRISWLQVSGSICKHLHLFWQLHLQSTKEHKRTISALSGSSNGTYWNMVLDVLMGRNSTSQVHCPGLRCKLKRERIASHGSKHYLLRMGNWKQAAEVPRASSAKIKCLSYEE